MRCDSPNGQETGGGGIPWAELNPAPQRGRGAPSRHLPQGGRGLSPPGRTRRPVLPVPPEPKPFIHIRSSRLDRHETNRPSSSETSCQKTLTSVFCAYPGHGSVDWGWADIASPFRQSGEGVRSSLMPTSGRTEESFVSPHSMRNPLFHVNWPSQRKKPSQNLFSDSCREGPPTHGGSLAGLRESREGKSVWQGDDKYPTTQVTHHGRPPRRHPSTGSSPASPPFDRTHDPSARQGSGDSDHAEQRHDQHRPVLGPGARGHRFDPLLPAGDERSGPLDLVDEGGTPCALVRETRTRVEWPRNGRGITHPGRKEGEMASPGNSRSIFSEMCIETPPPLGTLQPAPHPRNAFARRTGDQ